MPELNRDASRRVPAGLVTSCLALFLVVPFILPFNTLPVQTFYQEWTAFLLGCALLIASVWLQRGSALQIPRTAFLPLGICILVLIQGLSGRWGYWQQGATAAIYLFWSGAMLCAGRMLRAYLGWERFCSAVAWAVCVGALISAVIGLLQLTGSQFGGLVMPMAAARVHANLAQSNLFADYICLGLFSVCFLAATHRMHAVFAAGAVLLLLVAANVSGQRGVWAYFLTAVLLAGWTHYRKPSAQTRTLLLWVIGAVAAMLVLAIVSTGLLSNDSLLGGSVLRHETGAERILAGHGGGSHRQSIWLAAWRMFESAPVAGVGYGGFAWKYFLSLGQLPAGLPEEIVDNAHNVLLQVLAELGLPGGILLIAAAALWSMPRFRETVSVYHWWLLALIAVIVLHSLVEYPLWYAHFLGLFAVLVGAADTAVWRLRPGKFASAAVALAGVLSLWALGSVFFDYRQVERLGIESAATRENKAVIVEAARISSTSLFGNLIELGLARTISLDGHALDAKLELNGRVLRAYPAPDVAYRQSALLALQGDVAAAYKLWDLAATAYPRKAAAVTDALAARLALGEDRLEPLVEYAASRSNKRQ